MQNAESVLKKIVAGNIDEISGMENRHVKMIVEGKRIPNIVMRQTVDKLKAKNMPPDKIIEHMLKFDDLAERGELINYLNEQKQPAKPTN